MKVAEIGLSTKITYVPPDMASAWRKLNSMIGASTTPSPSGAVSKSNFRNRYPKRPITLMMVTSIVLELTA